MIRRRRSLWCLTCEMQIHAYCSEIISSSRDTFESGSNLFSHLTKVHDPCSEWRHKKEKGTRQRASGWRFRSMQDGQPRQRFTQRHWNKVKNWHVLIFILGFYILIFINFPIHIYFKNFKWTIFPIRRQIRQSVSYGQIQEPGGPDISS